MSLARPLVVERSGGMCEAVVTEVCHGRAVHIHHRRYKSAGGDNSLENLLHVCLACHAWIHANKETARALGITPDWNEPRGGEARDNHAS